MAYYALHKVTQLGQKFVRHPSISLEFLRRFVSKAQFVAKVKSRSACVSTAISRAATEHRRLHICLLHCSMDGGLADGSLYCRAVHSVAGDVAVPPPLVHVGWWRGPYTGLLQPRTVMFVHSFQSLDNTFTLFCKVPEHRRRRFRLLVLLHEIERNGLANLRLEPIWLGACACKHR